MEPVWIGADVSEQIVEGIQAAGVQACAKHFRHYSESIASISLAK